MALSVANLHFRPQVPVFDAQVCVGHGRLGLSPAGDRATLLAELGRHGVGRALVYHAHAEEVSPLRGNELLEPWLGPDRRLLPLWSVFPSADSVAQIEGLHGAGRVRAARLSHVPGLPLAGWSHGALLDWLSAARVPLWLSLPELDPRDIVATLRAFPRLAVVLTGAHYSHALLVEVLMAELPNIRLELSRFEPLDGVGRLAARFGAGRLIYGSWYPRYAIGPVLFFLHRSGLSEDDLARICGGNLEQLLGLPAEGDDG